MHIFNEPKFICGVSAALGFFDGLHMGHQSVIKAAAEEKKNGLTPAMITFSENPRSILTGAAIERLMTAQDRYDMLERLGIEILYELDFESVRNLSAEEFVKDVLKEKTGAAAVYCGFNYHFGRLGAGDEKTLRSLCSAVGIRASALPPVIFENEPISSTRIRNMLKQGDVSRANKMLGRRFSFNFKISRGNRLGRKMTTPTINQVFPKNFILPKFGVYAAVAVIDGISRPAVTNIGVKPTVGSDFPLSETWILNGEMGSLYGKSAKIELVEFIRPEKRFSGIEELRQAIINDGEKAKNILNALI